MAKSLFDPSKASGAEPAAPPSGSGARPLTVSQASDLIRHALERHTPASLRIVGQVSNLSARDHWYFSLKDDHAVLPCVVWATTARKLQVTLKDGDEVVVAGHLSHYAPQGRTQLYVTSIAPVGAGSLEMKFRALCEQLRALGYFEDSRKRPLPMFPRRIAVITSATGAAVQDVIQTAAQRCKAVGLLIVDVRVQGDGAAEEIARAIAWVDAKAAQLGVDAILVTRGGGSIEDLWAFNERRVADAIFRSHLPVVAAIGHESDTTIAELVSDIRASTPTQAAMRLVPAGSEMCRHLQHVTHRIDVLLRRMIERRREAAARASNDLGRIIAAHMVRQRVRTERLAARLAQLRPEAVLAQRAARLHISGERLHAAMWRRIAQREVVQLAHQRIQASVVRRLRLLREHLVASQRQLSAVDPHAVLRRGYSITTMSRGGVVRSVTDVQQGELIATRVSDGSFGSIVSAGGVAVRRVRAAPRAAGAGDQFDLFH